MLISGQGMMLIYSQNVVLKMRARSKRVDVLQFDIQNEGDAVKYSTNDITALEKNIWLLFSLCS